MSRESYVTPDATTANESNSQAWARGKHRSPGRAGIAPERAGIWRSPGRAGLDIVPALLSRLRVRPMTMSCRATLAAERPGASVPVTKQAAGAPSAWSQSFNCPPRDRADGATLGRRRRTRRPGLRKGSTRYPPHPPLTTSRPQDLTTSRPHDLKTSRPHDLIRGSAMNHATATSAANPAATRKDPDPETAT